MASITWKNVAAPSLAGVSDTLSAAGESFERSTGALDAVLKGHTNRLEKNWDAQAKVNTAEILKRRRGITDLGQAREEIEAGPSDEFGIQYDEAALKAGSSSILDKLRERASSVANIAGEAAAQADQSPHDAETAFLASMKESGATDATAQNSLLDFRSGTLSQVSTGWDEAQDNIVDEAVETYRSTPGMDSTTVEQELNNRLDALNYNPKRKLAALQSYRNNVDTITSLSDSETSEVANQVFDIKTAAAKQVGEISATATAYEQEMNRMAPAAPGIIKEADELWSDGKLAGGSPVDAIMERIGDGGFGDYLNLWGAEFGSDAKKILFSSIAEAKEKGVTQPQDLYRLLFATFADFEQRSAGQSFFGKGEGIISEKSFMKSMADKAEGMSYYRIIEDKLTDLRKLEENTRTDAARNVAQFETKAIYDKRRRKITPGAGNTADALRDSFKSKISFYPDGTQKGGPGETSPGGEEASNVYITDLSKIVSKHAETVKRRRDKALAAKQDFNSGTAPTNSREKFLQQYRRGDFD